MPTLATSPTGSSLQRLTEQAWQRLGEDATLTFEGQTLTAGELQARVRRTAVGLQQLGIRPGERVVACMSNCPEVGILYNAVWRAGAVTTPVLFLLSEDELRHVLVDSGAAAIVTSPEWLPKVQAAAANVETLRSIVLVGAGAPVEGTVDWATLEAAEEGELVDSDPTSLAALLYTGGTTGRSKGVMLSHDAMSTAAWSAVTSGWEPEQRVSLLPLPLSHAYGLLVQTLALHVPEPSDTILMRWFDPTGWLDLAESHRVTTAAVVPSMLQMLLAQDLEARDLSALRRVTSGGAPLLAETREQWERRMPHAELAEGYGCTESAALISSSPLGGIRAGSVGKPVPSVTVTIRDAEGRPVATGEDGEICVAGDNVMTGYWNAPEETAVALRPDDSGRVELHTGDVGHLDADGYLYVVDRIKDLIIRSGINVYPRDVEDAMLTHPDVVGAGVVGKPDPTYGEEVVAFVALRPGATVTPEELREWAREHISRAKYPRDIRVVDAIPLTSVLKTDRKALRTLL